MNAYYNNNKPILIIPNVNKQLIQAAEDIESTSVGIIILIILLAIRAQITSYLSQSQFDKQFIQQLASVKWNARLLAKLPIVRQLKACLSIAETSYFELSHLKNLGSEEQMEYIIDLAYELASSPPDPKAKTLNPRAINEYNIKSHRLALMSRYTGIWQAQPLFNPDSLIRNISIATLTPEELGKLILELHTTLEIKVEPSFSRAILKAKEENNPNPLTQALKTVVDEQFSEEIDGPKIIFEDAITLDTPNNLLPLETLFPFIVRTKANDSFLNESPIPSELLKSPLLSYAANMNEKIKAEFKKTTPKPKRAAKSKPKPKAKG